MNAVISIHDLWFRYSRDDILRGVSFDVPPGCVCGLVGENGVGKTRLLQELSAGDDAAAERLMPIVYEELRGLAHARLAPDAISASSNTRGVSPVASSI